MALGGARPDAHHIGCVADRPTRCDVSGEDVKLASGGWPRGPSARVDAELGINASGGWSHLRLSRSPSWGTGDRNAPVASHAVGSGSGMRTRPASRRGVSVPRSTGQTRDRDRDGFHAPQDRSGTRSVTIPNEAFGTDLGQVMTLSATSRKVRDQ